ncbi:hypothetical protein BROUX41_003033 [Berkeleyomyces rouxiae]|uniref:uncharacterized protein n=1 Tax=Berkeleyomyces rouxiae TaxID=2035830 RepID=UPI003B768D93
MPNSQRPHPTAPSDAGSSISGLSPAPDPAPPSDSLSAPPFASTSAPATAATAPANASSRPGVTILAPGEEPPASLLAALSSELNPRSCITCRRRKVRCDKHMPCSNCRRNQIQCVFPAPGRAPRRPRMKDPNAPIKNPSEREAELLKRLHKLESIVEELSSQLDAEQLSRHSAGGSPDTIPGAASPSQGLASPTHGTPSSVTSTRDESGATRKATRRPRVEDATEGTGNDPTLNNKFGRLMLSDKARGQYVANAFWSKLTQQIDDIRNDAFSLSEDSEYSDEGTPESFHNSVASGTASHCGFFFGCRSSSVDLSKLRPRTSDIPFLWKTYCTNVEPVVRVIHVPTWSMVINHVQMGNATLSIQKEAMLFAFYFAAITSLEDEEIEKRFNASKERLLAQYRFAFEQALAQAEFLTVPDLTIINALALFLTVVRTSDDSRFCWTMAAVAVRLAEALGLQRDGTNFNLTPFEIEMRRRIWWTICAFDLRASEESGTDSSALVFNCDTKMPANINDADFGPESTEIVSRPGTTDISLVLVRHEITKLCRRMILMSDRAPTLGQPNALQSIREREETLVEMHRHIETTYFQCPEIETDSRLILGSMIVRVVVAKMSLVIYQPLLLGANANNNNRAKDSSSKDSKPSEYNDRVYMAAVEIIEGNVKLHTEERFRQWRWLFATYTQWHAIAFVLMEVSHRPWSANMERGWDIVTRALNQKEVQEFAKKPNHMTVWLPLRKLITKATRNRNAEIQRLKANPMEIRKLDMEDRMISSQRYIPLSKDLHQELAQLRERWLRLVSANAADAIATPPKSTNQTPPTALTHAMLQNMQQTYAANDQHATGSIKPEQPHDTPPDGINPIQQQLQQQQQQQPQVGLNIMMNQPMGSMVLWDLIDQNAQTAMLGNMQMQPHDNPIAAPPNSQAMHRAAAPPIVPSHMQPHQHQNEQQQSPHVHSAPPNSQPGFEPWGWSGNWYDHPGNAKGADNPLAAGIAAGPTSTGPVAGMNAGGMFIGDESGMEVDEDFNWASWEQSMRSLQAPPGLYQAPATGL